MFRICVGIFVVLMSSCFRVEATPLKEEVEKTWRGLRGIMLKHQPELFDLPPGSDQPYVFAMEIAIDGSVATIAAAIDGTVSLYISTGGGVIGTGQKKPEFAKEQVPATRPYVRHLQPTKDFPSPAQGNVRFFVLDGRGAWTAEVSQASLHAGDSPLVPLYEIGHALLTFVRTHEQP